MRGITAFESTGWAPKGRFKAAEGSADTHEMGSAALDAEPTRTRASGTRGLLVSPPSALIGALLLLHALMALTMIARAGHTRVLDDVSRFERIGVHEGEPYRDFPVEYAPVETVTVLAVAGDGLDDTARRVAAIALACDLATVAALWWGFGRRPAALYLLISLPLVPLMFARLDLLVVGATVIGLACAARGRARAGGALLALATLTKLWPIVVTPALARGGRRRGLAWFGAIFLAGMLAWVAYGGVDAVRQVATFRGASGWHAESVIGNVVQLVTGEPSRLESGARRVGHVPGWAGPALLVLLAVTVSAIWWDARRRPGAGIGGPSLAATSALVVSSPLFSLQYVLWLMPFAALAWHEGDEVDGRLAFGVSILTGTLTMLYLGAGAYGWDARGPAPWLILARNAALLAIPLRRLWGAVPARRRGVGSSSAKAVPKVPA